MVTSRLLANGANVFLAGAWACSPGLASSVVSLWPSALANEVNCWAVWWVHFLTHFVAIGGFIFRKI